MSYKVSIKCHGVIAYIADAEENPKNVALFLPRAGRRAVPRQVAYLRFPRAQYNGSGAVIPSNDPESRAHLVLKRERLWIDQSNVVDPGKLVLNYAKDKISAATPTIKDNRSLYWVPNLHKLSDGHCAIRNEYVGDLHALKTVADPRLIARFDCSFGNFGTAGADSVQVPFAPAKRSGDVIERHPIARELLLEFEVNTPKLIIRSEKFNGRRSKTYEFTVPANGLELTLGNESETDIYQASPAIQPADTLAAVCMAEFKFYYRMSDEPQEGALFPYLSSRPGTDTCCSVAGFAPHPFHGSYYADATDNAVAVEAETVDPSPKWGLLAFLAADNSLSALADDELDKLERPNDGVAIMVQVDRFQMPTERLILEDEGFVPIDGPFGNLNAGDYKVLRDFIRDGIAKLKTTHTAVFLLTHGAGILDFTFGKPKPKPRDGCLGRLALYFYRFQVLFKLFAQAFKRALHGQSIHVDWSPRDIAPDATCQDFLDNQELAKALRDGGDGKLSIIGFDACVMALVEIAYELRECGRYMVASQDDVRLEGIPYERILKHIKNANPQTAVREIVQRYGNVTRRDPFATMSGVDLDEASHLIDALNVLGRTLLNFGVKQNINALARAHNRARAFMNINYVDLHGFMEGLLLEVDDNNVEGDARKVIAALRKAVLCTSNDAEPGKKNAYGLSVYLPNGGALADAYAKLAFTKEKTAPWYLFVVQYAEYRKDVS